MAPTNVTAYLAARVGSESHFIAARRESKMPNVAVGIYDHGAALSSGSVKGHMMDISLVGKDDVLVKAARFILACYSPVLEEVFYKGRECLHYHKSDDGVGLQLVVGFCSEEVLLAAVHHCFSGELPTEFSTTSPREQVVRNLAQLNHFAYMYKFSGLGEVTYKALRKLINARPVLSCAIFDELSYREGVGSIDSIKRYALDTMREMPMDTLLAGGVQWMREESVEAIMQDQDMDVDEFYMFKILNAWAFYNPKERVPVARQLSEHIELKYIDPELLESDVKKSKFFPEKKIMEAVNLIKNSLANRDPSEMERVLVEGAGTELVNGIYCRVDEDLGISEEEFLFVKEADDGFSDVGLYLWGTKWHIAMCTDYSNCFYSCADPPSRSCTELVPATGWGVQYNGKGPAPYCTYLPITRMGRSTGSTQKSMMAPSLEEMIDPTIAEKRRSGFFDKRTDDVIEKRTLTLEQMMHLPEDRGECESPTRESINNTTGESASNPTGSPKKDVMRIVARTGNSSPTTMISGRATKDVIATETTTDRTTHKTTMETSQRKIPENADSTSTPNSDFNQFFLSAFIGIGVTCLVFPASSESLMISSLSIFLTYICYKYMQIR